MKLGEREFIQRKNDRPRCQLNSSNTTYQTKQGYPYHSGISTKTVGAKAISLHTVTIPPGEREKAHLHSDHETAVYQISGETKLWFGENLEECYMVGPGEFLYIPPNTPHLPINPSCTEPCVVVVARTDSNEQVSVVLLPHLDKLSRD